jgi:hypothetical protein
MSIIQTSYKTISCNGPNCDKTVTFEAGKEQEVANETLWFKTIRLVQTAQGRNLCYCSDQCELENIAAGAHNPEERKKIALPEGANAIDVAARQAQEAEKATKALKSGAGVTLH